MLFLANYVQWIFVSVCCGKELVPFRVISCINHICESSYDDRSQWRTEPSESERTFDACALKCLQMLKTVPYKSQICFLLEGKTINEALAKSKSALHNFLSKSNFLTLSVLSILDPSCRFLFVMNRSI